MQLSLIIPMYKVEAYIGQCLESCINQEGLKIGSDYEIICVNDGSPDRSAVIAKKIASSHKGILIIDQENKGLSGARNAGLKEARGDYIWFIDSDDWIDASALKKLYPYCDGCYDLLSFCAADVIADNEFKVRQNKKDIDRIPTNGISLLNHPSWCPPVCLNVYKRKFLIDNKLAMMEGVLHEDSEFEPRAYFYAQKAIAINEVLYYVRPNPTSITRSINPKRAFDLLIVSNSLHNFNAKINNPVAKTKISQCICECLNVAFSNYKLLGTKDKKRLLEALDKSNDLFINFGASASIKHRIEGFLFFISPGRKTMVFLYSLIHGVM